MLDLNGLLSSQAAKPELGTTHPSGIVSSESAVRPVLNESNEDGLERFNTFLISEEINHAPTVLALQHSPSGLAEKLSGNGQILPTQLLPSESDLMPQTELSDSKMLTEEGEMRLRVTDELNDDLGLVPLMVPQEKITEGSTDTKSVLNDQVKEKQAHLRLGLTIESRFSTVVTEDGLKQSLPANADLNDALLPKTSQPNVSPVVSSVIKELTGRQGGNRLLISEKTGIDGVSLSGLSEMQRFTSAQTTGTSAPTTLSLATPVGESAWAQEIGSKINWMVNQQIQAANVKLNPAHLGPMEIKVVLKNDEMTIQMTAQHAVVREALDAAMPRLRDTLAENGLQLGSVDVLSPDQEQNRQYQQTDEKTEREQSMAEEQGDAGDVDKVDVKSTALGLIDTYV